MCLDLALPSCPPQARRAAGPTGFCIKHHADFEPLRFAVRQNAGFASPTEAPRQTGKGKNFVELVVETLWYAPKHIAEWVGLAAERDFRDCAETVRSRKTAGTWNLRPIPLPRDRRVRPSPVMSSLRNTIWPDDRLLPAGDQIHGRGLAGAVRADEAAEPVSSVTSKTEVVDDLRARRSPC